MTAKVHSNGICALWVGHVHDLCAVRWRVRLLCQEIKECARAELGRAKAGGQGRNRTSDTRIFSAVLYQLSYLALRSALRRTYRSPSITCTSRTPFDQARDAAVIVLTDLFSLCTGEAIPPWPA